MPHFSLTWFLDVADPTLPPTPLTIPDRENYTSVEVGTAVEKLVNGAIRRPYGILGERQTGTAFDDTMDAAAGVFILTAEAPFYVLLLGSRRLTDVITSIIDDAIDLLTAIENTGRRVRPLTSITSLGNARTALAALEAASTARDSVFEDISQAPAFQRFDTHTDRFLNDAAGAIRVGTEIVQTPQQARGQLAGLVSSVTTAMSEVQRRVALLAGGIDDYNSLNLPALLASGVISRARAVLQDRITQLEALSPTARLEFLRETVLDVLAGKAVVRGFGSLARSGEFVPIEGVGVPFADVDHPGTQATAESTLLDPYSILTGADELTFALDGGADTVSVVLPKSYLAAIEGTSPEPYAIVASTNDETRIGITGSGTTTVTLTPGAARTAYQVANQITAGMGSRPVVAEPYFQPQKFIGSATAQNNVGAALEWVIIGTTWNAVDVEVGDFLQPTTGSMAGSLFSIDSIVGATASTTLLEGVAANEVGVTVTVGVSEFRYLRIRISDAGALSALDNSRLLRLIDTDDTAYPTLGFFPGMEIYCRRTRADELATSINANASSSLLNQPRISAVATFVGGDITTGRSEPTDPTKVVSTLYRAFGTITNDGPTPAHFAVAGALAAGIEVGGKLVIRGSTDGGDVGLSGTITLVTDTEVRANMGGLTTLASAVDLEFGLDLNIERDQVIRIFAPSPLAGDYRVADDVPSFATEAVLDRVLPFATGPGGQGLTFNMQIGAFRLDFKSQSTLTNSALSITGTAATKFFTTVPATAAGSTPFVLLAKDPRVLGIGDVLETYTAQYNVPELSFTIIGFESGQQLLELDVPMPNGTTLDFSQTITTPFARIRKVARNNFDAFKVQLGLWLALSVNETGFFRDLNRFLNPLIVNENPTLAAVSTAKTQVQSLVQALQQLQVVLASYEVDVVPQVDTLIDSFLSRGSDRAVDTLLEGRFTEFFGYNSEEVSYLGNSLERLRDVSRLDLPVRRVQRKEVADQELSLGEFEEPDFEFDQSDTMDVNEVDIPGQFIEVSGGSS